MISSKQFSALPKFLKGIGLAMSIVVLLFSSARAQDSLDVLSTFVASGFMGDNNNIQLYEAWNAEPYDSTDVDSSCVRITYSPSDKGFGGIYWQNVPNNWGDASGEDYSGRNFTSIIFWAKGERGGEVVEFIGGGISDPQKKYKDSFRATAGRVRLTTHWQRHTINLTGKDLRSVIGAFCWVASGNANPAGLTFYIKGVKYIR